MNAEAQDVILLPPSVARRGISETQWRTLMNNLYPGASGESVLMVWDYCAARKLDPLKKPCHIVPMKVKQGGDYVWRDVVLPGIYEYRTTAHRTGQYLGHSVPVYGEIKEIAGVMAPESCELTVYRWNPLANVRGEYPIKALFTEYVALKDGKANSRWAKAPLQMLTKCAEAAGLREAFPDELGGVPTMEEVEGQIMEGLHVEKDLGPRSDANEVDWDIANKWVNTITDILNQDKEEAGIAEDLRTADTELCNFDALYTMVLDKLASGKIISKANWRKYLKIGLPVDF